MEIKKNAVAGTTESSDIMIMVDRNDKPEIEIHLQSDVENQFGNHIRNLIKETAEKLGVSQVKIKAVDKGALDCTIMARTITALHRAAEMEQYDWRLIDSWNA